MMSVWSSLVGQDAAVAKLSEAAASARAIVASRGSGRATDEARSMSHAWLITGPPGSGRSVAARAFAAALQCTGEAVGCGQCAGCRTTMGRTNADVVFAATETSIINVDTARSLVLQAQSSPSQGLWRVIVVEDADRLGESGANALLKAIEEPPEHTVWLLCAPSPEDMIATIRSRCRHLGLRIPTAAAVADLLVREGVASPEVALEAARAAQSHIGLARALARDPQMRERRLLETAKAQADAQVSERNAREKAELMRQLGMEEGESATKASRTMIRQLEEDQKRRSKRALTDAIDRALIDLLAIYRDVLMVQVGGDGELINTDLTDLVRQIADDSTPRQTLARVDHIETARKRLVANGNPLLVLEDMAISLRPQA